MPEIHTLDVTLIEPRLKHPTIFQHFDALQEGEAFVIHNDHDPKPLYYQLLGERGDIFTWEYLEQGPAAWRIKIAKKTLNTAEETVGSIAAKDLRKAAVFRKFGIDFCCNGKRTLKEACDEAGIPVEQVKEGLEHLPEQSGIVGRDFNNWDLDFLADYIVNVHHRYVTDAIPLLAELSQKVAGRHGTVHPELHKVYQHTTALLTEMRSHQIKEEKILFPFIKKMVQAERENEPAGHPPFGTIESPVQMMMHDHDSAARHVHAIEELTGHYEVPGDGCESYKLYYHKLHEFNEDLYQHLHLENNILFPKAIELEKKLVS